MFYKTIILIFALLLLNGCQSAYYSAMEKVGTHKRDILIDRVEEATTSQEEAKEEFISALEQLSKLIAFDGGELQTQYELSKDSFESSQEAAEEVSARIDAIEDVAEALFDEWRDEIKQYSNQSLKRQSERQLNTTEKRYLTVIKAMHKAEDRMSPILASLKDNMLYLKHNLNAKAIGALKGEYKVIKQDIDRLIMQMNQSIKDSQAFITALKS
ncbi:DUF2959 domain-containing protein [Thalassotalea castellviae]|uniref:DUF2959 domain-containing protein n=1 Tax=Thalassotalea castellviae TaxID=3075612 RepID=A0ABU3A4Q0_9GAMM|nr:DUF2959 domain-containing protein [Thalassotalea sp. W431]MDT0605153.1 DUF2959 domain-containing protein [Thalassotalea sp. W431]